MPKFNLANVDRSYMFRLLQNKHHQDVYNILKNINNYLLYITAVYSCYIQAVH